MKWLLCLLYELARDCWAVALQNTSHDADVRALELLKDLQTGPIAAGVHRVHRL